MMSITVGQPWPGPAFGEGMHAVVSPDEEAGINLMLLVGCDKPTAGELTGFDGPLRLAVMSRPPLAWIALDAGRISWDAPFAAAVEQDGGLAVRAGAARNAALPDELRGLVHIVLADRGRVLRNRFVSLSRAWWREFAGAIAAGPDHLDRTAYARAIAQQQAELTTAQMIALASIVERAGKL